MIPRIYQALTGKPWVTTTLDVTTDVGPTIRARFPELDAFTDLELMRMTPDEAISTGHRLRADQQRRTAPRALAHQ
ncbi:hypothetical protein ACFQZ4_54190 [Catellatospora coxensis]|uniref:Uncharacterized protein n=1 Tax=Catellatospora coxensis TaxID=310354 RepID=A0A8J3LEN4_9ACTN|nr:hypothetical protein [Catellatospora coxensis]GIG11325.1 hypothetical protein Cco03nite_80250 [Catellatospora coxensis]